MKRIDKCDLTFGNECNGDEKQQFTCADKIGDRCAIVKRLSDNKIRVVMALDQTWNAEKILEMIRLNQRNGMAGDRFNPENQFAVIGLPDDCNPFDLESIAMTQTEYDKLFDGGC